MLMAQQVGKLVWLMSKVSQHSRRCWTFSCATGMKLVLGSLFTQQIFFFFSPLKFLKVHLLAPGFCQQCLYRQSLLYSSEATCQILDKAYIPKIRIRGKKKNNQFQTVALESNCQTRRAAVVRTPSETLIISEIQIAHHSLSCVLPNHRSTDTDGHMAACFQQICYQFCISISVVFGKLRGEIANLSILIERLSACLPDLQFPRSKGHPAYVLATHCMALCYYLETSHYTLIKKLQESHCWCKLIL